MFTISTQTIHELENIKTSSNKDEAIKAAARNVLRLLVKDEGDKISVVPTTHRSYDILEEHHLPVTTDNLIIAGALNRGGGILFGTDDLACFIIAKTLGLNAELNPHLNDDEEASYKGYVTIQMSDDEMADFYGRVNENKYELLVNQYLSIKNSAGDVVDVRRWDGQSHVPIYDKGIKTIALGTNLKPRDEYQKMAIDSIMNNTVTMLSGTAGSGKTLISLASIFHLIEKGLYTRVIVFTNPCKVRGASDMGYYSGSMLEKALQNSIGNILTTKFGDRYMVDQLIAQDKIRIVSVADCRGMEVRDDEILFMSEGENCSIDMLKLLLSRASQKAKVIIEGDFDAQVDHRMYEGTNNGMRRAVTAFKGDILFGYVELPKVWRSRLAEMAQKL